MNERRTDDSQTDEIEDLPGQAVEAWEAEQVKGGFNPQPDPPKIGAPVYQPPIYNPGVGIIR